MKVYINSIKEGAESGLRLGVTVAAIVAPTVLVLAMASWITKKK